jgi:sugar phosphate isomerase/epimerase
MAVNGLAWHCEMEKMMGISPAKRPALIKGPAIFLAQFMSDEAPFNCLDDAARTMGEMGYRGLQLHSNDPRCMNLELAASSKDYCDELRGTCAKYGIEITELSTHIQGQLLAVHPAYDLMFDGFAPPEVRGNPAVRTQWAHNQMLLAAKASANLGLDRHATFSGALAWPYVYPWPQRPEGLIEEAFAELARRWTPVLNAFDEAGVDVAYELHPGEDLHDGITFERFLDSVGQHSRANILYDPSHFVLQQLDYLEFIDIYHERIRCFHVKDAEFRPNGRVGAYGGYGSWLERAGRFRSPGDGQIDFRQIFSRLSRFGFDGWAVVEWECALKDSMQGARESAEFVNRHIIHPATRSFDDFAGTGADRDSNLALLGLAARTIL